MNSVWYCSSFIQLFPSMCLGTFQHRGQLLLTAAQQRPPADKVQNAATAAWGSSAAAGSRFRREHLYSLHMAFKMLKKKKKKIAPVFVRYFNYVKPPWLKENVGHSQDGLWNVSWRYYINSVDQFIFVTLLKSWCIMNLKHNTVPVVFSAFASTVPQLLENVLKWNTEENIQKQNELDLSIASVCH